MRILSQDGTIDVPYEQVIVQISGAGDNSIIAYTNIEQDGYLEIAAYSAEANAKRAMEMLRTAFEDYELIKATGNTEEFKTAAGLVSEKEFEKMTASYFRFPADDELEG